QKYVEASDYEVSSIESEDEVEENLAPEGFEAYHGGIRVFKQDDRYTAKPIGDAAEVPGPAAETIAADASDDEELEGGMDDDDDALIF
ncbi:MAG: hypothetical protein SGARI_001491, partial [Bacillariaceae sp.]